MNTRTGIGRDNNGTIIAYQQRKRSREESRMKTVHKRRYAEDEKVKFQKVFSLN